ncbi:TlyA family RNA methyltransferase [Ureaplasma miroungigenitalium]|uniref:TlyA family RNA methyltransferase n=1 Tax=Ureaplasma miroungigenitalium TaxID=1042321 RepID=A0ABT3BN42_9BACT|nr:TlyA family RNA methyltransferase [Ureaplasma miroungigenitalium]MCV3728659.1 TlyA family RNA methyltransferase [Ureaplasma miroungigenitalium]MCV3734350.1 TlyA family RNA methyltransferase [Ureaplasma miroungigenitalium]
MRLDLYLVAHNLAKTRSQAVDLIKRGFIFVNDQNIYKPAYQIQANDFVICRAQETYVSKGAYKLLKIQQAINYDFKNKIVLDLGASTGGFSDVCLRMQAAKVYCVDVAEGILDPLIKNDPRVVVYDKTNIKDLKNQPIGHEVDTIVADLSFISLSFAFAAIKHLCHKGLDLIWLIKPQFEATPQIMRACKGVLKDPQWHTKIIEKIKSLAQQYGFKYQTHIPVDIFDAKKQNQEYMIYFTYV